MPAVCPASVDVQSRQLVAARSPVVVEPVKYTVAAVITPAVMRLLVNTGVGGAVPANMVLHVPTVVGVTDCTVVAGSKLNCVGNDATVSPPE